MSKEVGTPNGTDPVKYKSKGKPSQFTYTGKQFKKDVVERDRIKADSDKIVGATNKETEYGSFDIKTAPSAQRLSPRYEHLKGQVNTFGDLGDLEKLAYQGQNGAEIVINTAVGFLLNAKSGILGGAGSNDPVAMANMLAENGNYNYKNRFQRWADSAKSATQDRFPIYKDGDNVWNAAYWGDQLSNAGYSMGLYAEAMAEQYLLAQLTRGVGNVALFTAKGVKAAATVGKMSKMAKAGEAVSNFAKSGRAFGAFQGVKNSYMNALGAGEATYNKYKKLGHTEEESRQKAAEASALNFKIQAIPLMILNGFQYQAVSGKYNPFTGGKAKANTGLGSVIETFAERALPKLSNKLGKKTVDYGVQILSEGFEEGLETAMSSYAEWKVLEGDDLNKGKTLQTI